MVTRMSSPNGFIPENERWLTYLLSALQYYEDNYLKERFSLWRVHISVVDCTVRFASNCGAHLRHAVRIRIAKIAERLFWCSAVSLVNLAQ